ncbi:MAG: outer membrane lipid asymmetry maintenance protein MlaD [Alphaproteobacteria bacterium]
MRRNVFETVIGALVLLVAAWFLYFSYTRSGVRDISGYEVLAKFDRIDGIESGSDVRMSGIKIGTVTRQELDPETYLAVVRMQIDPRIRLPTDSSAEIASAGLLGSRYLALVPGGSERMLEPGGEIRFTQSAVSLEHLIGRFMFSDSGDGAAKPN